MSNADSAGPARPGRSRPTSIKRAALLVVLGLGLIPVGGALWDAVQTLHFQAASSVDGGAGYGTSLTAGPGERRQTASPGYSTGPDDKNYLRLPGVPDYPGRSRPK